MTAGHLVARLQLALHRHEHLDHLEHTRRQIVATLDLFDAIFVFRGDQLDGIIILHLDRFKIGLPRIIFNRNLPPFMMFDVGQAGFVNFAALFERLGSR